MAIAKMIIWLLLLPVVAGTALTLSNALNWQIWPVLFQTPALFSMLGLTLWVALASTFLSLATAFCFISIRSKWFRGRSIISPVLAIPHSAIAIGVLFLLAPSGWIMRLVAQLMGWDIPPDWLSVRDPYGFSLIVALWLKEAPFLILMSINGCSQLPINKLLVTGRSLGYHPFQCWFKLIWPQLYLIIRSPLFIVLLFSISVVEVPLIIGPNLPPVFQVQLLHWLQDPLLESEALAAAASLLLVSLSAIAVIIWLLSEKLFKTAFKRFWLFNTTRSKPNRVLAMLFHGLSILPLALAGLALIVIVLRSFSWRWPFPDLLPQLTTKSWERYLEQLLPVLADSLTIGFISTTIGLALSILVLQSGLKIKKTQKVVLYLPLILPQLIFIPGIQKLLLWSSIDGYLLTVALIHLLFVFPYCMLSLSGPWQQLDPRLLLTARALGRTPWQALLQIRLPMMLQPLLTTFALGFAVSCALYIPTLFAGSGRVSTLMTEAVALSSGGNRRLLALYACLQMLAPVVIWLLAIWLPRFFYRHRSQLLLNGKP
ncbi:ABC transporter permease [Pelagibaculum spongiae]|uniref:ABC transporter permease n=1 Tax=Pelagibaculum spongiae TaxID=2080658 RepID=A0A2V1H3Z9_9GAMM|nr:ABC transporter permease subunit [Pelagibaculum spongiae]PVZ71948.1 ABC transporter permease [Pelagibaculum spongiae]